MSFTPLPALPSLGRRAIADCCLFLDTASGDSGDGPSERDLTTGNASMWHLIFAKLVGISGHIKLSEETTALLDRLAIPRDGKRECDLSGIQDQRVWEVLVKGFDERKKR